MALTDEQRAMLQLLLEGGQSYEDIGSLLGITAEEVRSRARAALTEIGGADPDAQVPISDYLLGHADPIGRADAVRHLQSDPEANALAQRLVAQLRLLAPKAQLPEIPPARGGRRAAAPPPPPPPEAPQPPGAPPPSAPPPAAGGPSIRERVGGALGGSGPSRRQSQIAVGIGAGALLIIVVVLAVSGVFGSSDDDGDGGGGATATATTAANEDLTIVNLGPLGGDSSAQGQAVFARVEDQPVLQINLTGLQQAGKGETYILWLYNSDAVAFPLARDQANQQGNLTGAAAVPQEIVPLLPQFGCIDVSLASSRETAAALQQAAQGQTLPRHSGRSVLRGEIPDAGQQGASGADSNCEVAPPQEGGQSTTPTQ